MKTKLTLEEYASLDYEVERYRFGLDSSKWIYLDILADDNAIARRSLTIIDVGDMKIEIIGLTKEDILHDVAEYIYNRIDVTKLLSEYINKDVKENPEYRREILDAYNRIGQSIQKQAVDIIDEFCRVTE